MRRFTPVLSALVPDGWFVQESIRVSNGAGGVVVASVDVVQPGTTLELYAQEYGEMLARELPGFAELDLAETTLGGGTPGLLRRFRWTSAAGEPVTQLQLYALEDGRGVVATATAPTESFSELEPMLNELLHGFELTGASAGGSISRWEETPREKTYRAFVRGELIASRKPGAETAGEGGDNNWVDARKAWAEALQDDVRG